MPARIHAVSSQQIPHGQETDSPRPPQLLVRHGSRAALTVRHRVVMVLLLMVLVVLVHLRVDQRLHLTSLAQIDWNGRRCGSGEDTRWVLGRHRRAAGAQTRVHHLVRVRGGGERGHGSRGRRRGDESVDGALGVLREGHGVERDGIHTDRVRTLDAVRPSEVNGHSSAGTSRARDDLKGPRDLRRVVRHHRRRRRRHRGRHRLQRQGGERGGRDGGGGLTVRGGGGPQRGRGEEDPGVKRGLRVGHDDRGSHRCHAGADWLLGAWDVDMQRFHVLLLLLLDGLYGGHLIDDLQTAGQVSKHAVFDVLVDLADRAHVTDHLLGALVETGSVLADDAGVLRQDSRRLLTLQSTQVFHRQLQNVGLLQLGELRALHTHKQDKTVS